MICVGILLPARLPHDSRRRLFGYFKPLTCGASCSPAAIQWVDRGVRYEIAFKGTTARRERHQMISYANSAIRAGAR